MQELIKYNEAKKALAAAVRFDEVKHIHDKAAAMRTYAMQAKDCVMLNHAIELRKRAERRAGEMLQTIPKNKGAAIAGGKKDSPRGTLKVPRDSTPTLAELNISKKQSSKWRKLADMTESQFEEMITDVQQKASSAIDRSKRSKTVNSSRTGGKAVHKKSETIARHQKVIDLSDKGLSSSEIAAEVGLGERMVDRVKEIENTRRKAEPQIDPKTLAPSAQKKFEIAVRQHKRKLELEHSGRVSEEVKAILDRWLPEYNEKLAQAERTLNAYQGIMSRAHFRLVLACLSPDSRKGFTDQKLGEAFDVIKKLEIMLVKKEEQEKSTPAFQFPRTYEEAIRMKREVAARRKAKKTGIGAVQLA